MPEAQPQECSKSCNTSTMHAQNGQYLVSISTSWISIFESKTKTRTSQPRAVNRKHSCLTQ